MEKYFQFKQDFLREFTNWAHQGRKKNLLVTIFYLRVYGDTRSWRYMPKDFTGKETWGRSRKALTPTVSQFFELKKELAYVYLVEIVLNSNESVYVDAALYHLKNTLTVYDLSQFPLSEIKASQVEAALKRATNENVIEFLLSLAGKLPEPIDLHGLNPKASLSVVAQRLRNREPVEDLKYYVDLACDCKDEISYDILLYSLSYCDFDFEKMAKLLTNDEFRRGLFFQLCRREEAHFTDGWKLIFETLFKISLRKLYDLAGCYMRSPSFAKEFIESDMFPEFLKQAVDCSLDVARPENCFNELKKIKGDSWFVNEIYFPNRKNENKWMEIIASIGLDPQNEDVKTKVVPRIFDLLKSGKNIGRSLQITSTFSESSQFCDDNIHWLPVIFDCLLSYEWGTTIECIQSFCKHATKEKIVPFIKELEPKSYFYNLPLDLIVLFFKLVGSIDMFNRKELQDLIKDRINLEQYEPIIECSDSEYDSDEYDSKRGYWDRWGKWKYGKDPYRYEELKAFDYDTDEDATILFVALCNDKKKYERQYPRMARHFIELGNEFLCETALKSLGKQFRKDFIEAINEESPSFLRHHPNLAPYLKK